MKTRIIVDSTTDLMPQIKERVRIVPLTVRFGEEEFIDGVTIGKMAFYEKLIETDVMPTTSQATPDAFAKEFELAKQAGAVAVTFFKKLKHKDVMFLWNAASFAFPTSPHTSI